MKETRIYGLLGFPFLQNLVLGKEVPHRIMPKTNYDVFIGKIILKLHFFNLDYSSIMQ